MCGEYDTSECQPMSDLDGDDLPAGASGEDRASQYRHAPLLDLEEEYPGSTLIFFYHPNSSDRVVICRVDAQYNLVSMFPIVPWKGHDRELKPKYERLASIELIGFDFSTPNSAEAAAELFTQLPKGFVQDYRFGLGLKKEYALLINMVEKTGAAHLVIYKGERTFSPVEDQFQISYADFDAARRGFDRITRAYRLAAAEDRLILANNEIFHARNPEKFPLIEKKYKQGTVFKILAASNARQGLNVEDRNALVSAVAAQGRKIAKSAPDKLLELKEEIEVATLGTLIERFQGMLVSNHPESVWQHFFANNPFVLSLAFGFPVIVIRGQASVGGTRIGGDGGKIADFLLQHTKTGSAALVEIKTPSTPLLHRTAYRGDVFALHYKISGAVGQCLSQRHQLQKTISTIKDESDLPGLHAYAVHCLLLVGIMPESLHEKRSFELVRQAVHGVHIVTFDELLEKLKSVYAVLEQRKQLGATDRSESVGKGGAGDDVIPF